MDALQKILPLIGRICLAYLFIPAGWGKLGPGFAGTVGYAVSKGLPLASVAVGIALVIELIGGIAILVGYRTRWAAALLALFTIAAALFFHNYWAVPAEQQMAEAINFSKNVAIFGGLLFLVAWGPGSLSVDGMGANTRAVARPLP